jgi:hypothetical protein
MGRVYVRSAGSGGGLVDDPFLSVPYRDMMQMTAGNARARERE